MSVATPALPVRTERLWAALLAATLMNLPLGSVYAFSVLLRPIEQELAKVRAPLCRSSSVSQRWASRWGSVSAAFLYRAAPRAGPGAAERAGGRRRPRDGGDASQEAQLLLGYGIVFGTGGVCPTSSAAEREHAGAATPGLVNGYFVSLYPMGAMLAISRLPCLQRSLRLAHYPDAGWQACWWLAGSRRRCSPGTAVRG